jgi:hypothetical protein
MYSSDCRVTSARSAAFHVGRGEMVAPKPGTAKESFETMSVEFIMDGISYIY